MPRPTGGRYDGGVSARRTTTTAVAAVLLLFLACAAVWTVAGPARDRPRVADGDAAFMPPGDEVVGDVTGRRERRRVASAALQPGTAADGAARTADAPTGTEEAAPSGEPVTGGPRPEEIGRLFRQKQVDASGADGVLTASAERDPLRTMDPERVGAPPEMAFAAFVRGGVDTLDGAAELVGERRPDLERGDPVALTGRVLDAATGTPLAGASVVVSSTFYVRRHLYDHHLREIARAFTDDDGEFAVPRVDVDPAHFGRGGRLYVTVTAEGHAPALARPVAAVAPGATSRLPDVRLAVATHTLSGRIVDIWEGRPVAGARVYATGAIDPIAYPKDQRAALILGAPTAVTDEEGRFELTGLERGWQNVSAHGGDDCLGRERIAVPAASDVTLRMRGIGGRVEGSVVDARGDPVALVAVQGGGNTTHTFADGTFVLENFRAERLVIAFSHPDYRQVVVQDVADGTPNLLVRLESLQPAIRLRVRRDDDGAAVSEIRVLARGADGAPVRATSPVHLSDEGVHVLRIPEGAATLTVAAAGLRAVELDARTLHEGDTLDVGLETAE